MRLSLRRPNGEVVPLNSRNGEPAGNYAVNGQEEQLREAMIERFRPKGVALPVVIVTLPSLAIYDQIAATVGEAA